MAVYHRKAESREFKKHREVTIGTMSPETAELLKENILFIKKYIQKGISP